eukprot:7380323-Prymnesium_polylepis.2
MALLHSLRAVFRRAVQAKRAASSSLFRGDTVGIVVVAVGVIVDHHVGWPRRFRRDAGFTLLQICVCCDHQKVQGTTAEMWAI